MKIYFSEKVISELHWIIKHKPNENLHKICLSFALKSVQEFQFELINPSKAGGNLLIKVN